LKSREAMERIVRNWPAKILSLAAAFIIFMFHRVAMLEERYFSVPLNIVCDENYIPSGSYPKTVRISLRGRGENIFLIQEGDIEAFVDLTRYQNEGIFRVPVQIRKGGAALYVEPLEVQTEPIEVTIALERRLEKSVEVVPNIKGYPEAGYELVQYTVTPSVVDAVGPEGKLKNLTSVRTEEIDLKDRKEDFVIRIRLDKSDPLIDFPGGDIVEFRGMIREITMLKTFPISGLIYLDLHPDLSVSGGPVAGFLKVQGNQNTLQQLRDEDMRLTVDCSEIREAGVYTLSVKPDVPQGVTVLSYEPDEVVVRIVEGDE